MNMVEMRKLKTHRVASASRGGCTSQTEGSSLTRMNWSITTVFSLGTNDVNMMHRGRGCCLLLEGWSPLPLHYGTPCSDDMLASYISAELD